MSGCGGGREDCVSNSSFLGTVAEIAKVLGVSRATIYRHLADEVADR